MTVPKWLIWPLFAFIMGFLLGGSVFWGVLGPNNTVSAYEAKQTDQQSAEKITKNNEQPQSPWIPTDSVGLYTLVLAVFTGLLVAVSGAQGYFLIRADRTARTAANAAIKQSESIILAERPYVFMKIVKPGLKFDSNNRRVIPDVETMGRLHFEFINAGRTPAMLEEFKEYYPITGDLDPTPIDPMKDRGRLLPVGAIAMGDSPYPIKTNLFAEAIVPDIRKLIDVESAGGWTAYRLFFQGFIRYSDTFGNRYITGFLAAYSPLHGVWALSGGKQYNYSRQERPEDIPPHPNYPG